MRYIGVSYWRLLYFKYVYMTREQLTQSVLECSNSNILTVLPTGFGKSYIALQKIEQWLQSSTSAIPSILIVIPRLVLKDNWKEEFKKWGYEKYLPHVDFITYMAFGLKYTERKYDVIVYDEAHHISERCMSFIPCYITTHNILLTASINRTKICDLRYYFPLLSVFQVSVKEAIQDDTLPEPKIILIPLSLDDDKVNCRYVYRPKSKDIREALYEDRFKILKEHKGQVVIRCTQYEYYDMLESKIEYYKKEMYNGDFFRNAYLKNCGDRLKWLSGIKTPIVQEVLRQLKRYRTLTFCADISHTEELGKYCINSKNPDALQYLRDFNDHKINHITACNMLDEGVNIKDCQIGIYAMLNNSDRLIVQKCGRILRHKNPVLIIPYYSGTRDEEIMKKMLENYSTSNISVQSYTGPLEFELEI